MSIENRDPDIYRDNLAEELNEAPKEERKEILEQAKETSEYQIARNKKIEGRQEEEIDDGLGVFIKNKTLYHGSATPELKKKGFKIDKDNNNCTVGEGIYFVSKAKNAIGYARGREGQGRGGLSRKEEFATIYECSVENMKLLDLRKNENVIKIMPGWIKTVEKTVSELPEWKKVFLENDAFEIKQLFYGKELGSGNLQSAVHKYDSEFSAYVKSLGYDGLITLEGGELNYVKDHDSYVIFDPEKVKIIKEQKIKKEK